jgi:hypothetical protein
MSARPARHHYSYDEYLAYERDSGMKHEFDGGEIIARSRAAVRGAAGLSISGRR